MTRTVGRRAGRLLRRPPATLASVVVLVLVWGGVARGFGLVDTISTPTLVAVATADLLASMEWVPHVFATLRRTVFGFVVTLAVGTALGVLVGASRFWERALGGYVTVGLALPSLFAAVFAAMWFGISDLTPTVAGAAISFPFVAQGVADGVKDVDRRLVEMSTAFDVDRRRMLRRVVVKSVLPEWFSGARYAFAICWKITTLTELVAAGSGIGFMIEFEMRQLSITGVFSWTLLFVTVLVALEYGVFQRLERQAFAYRSEGVPMR